jgi:hypothetical protein
VVRGGLAQRIGLYLLFIFIFLQNKITNRQNFHTAQ